MSDSTLYISIIAILLIVVLACGIQTIQTKKLFERAQKGIKEGNMEELRQCVEKGLSQKNKDEDANTLLHCAAQNGTAEMILYLLSKGWDINAKNKQEKTPLIMAFLEGNHETACAIIDNGANIKYLDASGNTILHRVANQNNIAILNAYTKQLLESSQRLLGNDPTREESIKSVFSDTIQKCKTANPIIADYLLKRGVDYNRRNKKGLTPLDCAAKSGFTELVTMLMHLDADFSSEASSALCAAVTMSGDTSLIRKLMDSGIKLSSSSVFFAALSGNTDAVKLITDMGVPVDFQNAHEWTALLESCKCGNYTMAKLLVEKGANVNLAEKHGMAPLHLACSSGSIEIVTMLLQAGANPNQKSLQGYTPLKIQAAKNAEQIERLLIDAGAIE